MSDTNYIFEKLKSTCTEETLDKIENLMKNQNLKCNTTKLSKELHITNEEKARELFQSIPQCPYHIQYDETIENFTSIQLCELLEEMAKWKDEQFKRYLEKKKIEADKKMGDAYEGEDQWDYYIAEQNKQLFTEIINELFKKD